jgi:hypothetical protein
MNNIMVNPNLGSDASGSPITAPFPNLNQGVPEGQAGVTGGADGNGSKAYDELAARFGSQGQELGEYRTFIQNIAPLLDKLDQAPELVQAIIDGKVDKDIANAIVEGRVDVRDAATVQQAHEDVKDKLGAKAYDLATPESITKLVEAQVSKVRQEFEEKADLQNFQDYTQKFIEKTPDFQEYADEIDKWLDSHDVADIEVAYYAVKGEMSEANAQKVADQVAAERSKEMMSNAQGGGYSAQFTADGTPLVDRLIAGRPNPNSFFPGA